MRKINRFGMIVWISLLLAACTPQFAPTATLLPSTPSYVPSIPTIPAVKPSATPSGADELPSKYTLPPGPTAASPSAPLTIQGQFRITNTSQPDMEVGIETMAILLEAREPGAAEWSRVETTCSFTPAAPLVLKEAAIVQYECELAKPPPASAERRAVAEVTVFGSDQVFSIEIDLP